MDIQRLRNLTTGILHTKMADIYEQTNVTTRKPQKRSHETAWKYKVCEERDGLRRLLSNVQITQALEHIELDSKL